MYVCVYVCVCVRVCVSTGQIRDSAVYEPQDKCVYVCMCVCMYVCVYVCVYPQDKSGIARYMNHSGHPNVYKRIVIRKQTRSIRLYALSAISICDIYMCIYIYMYIYISYIYLCVYIYISYIYIYISFFPPNFPRFFPVFCLVSQEKCTRVLKCFGGSFCFFFFSIFFVFLSHKKSVRLC